MHSFQGTSRPDTTWHELGASLPLSFFVLHERHWPERARRDWERREAMHVDSRELVELVRCGLATACGGADERWCAG